MTGRGQQWALANWFFVLLPALLLVELAIVRSADWSDPGLLEHAILFDLCVFVPALYALCYRKTAAANVLIVRMVGLSCVGVFVGSRLIPPEAQTLFPHLAWARSLGIALLALIELKLLLEIIKLLFAGSSSIEDLASKSGAPRWMARLMLLEANFWRAVWKFIRGR